MHMRRAAIRSRFDVRLSPPSFEYKSAHNFSKSTCFADSDATGASGVGNLGIESLGLQRAWADRCVAKSLGLGQLEEQQQAKYGCLGEGGPTETEKGTSKSRNNRQSRVTF